MAESEKLIENETEAIDCLKSNKPTSGYLMLQESIDMAIKALEKQIAKKPKHTYIKHGKHTWKKNENGEIDDFAWDYDYHNGVVCEVCGEAVCVHCNPDYMELDDCEEEHWDCSSCGKEVYRNTKYCDCGQKLDWSDTEWPT